MLTLITNLRHDERGASAIEYALIASLISMTVVFWATLIGTTLTSTFTNVANNL